MSLFFAPCDGSSSRTRSRDRSSSRKTRRGPGHSWSTASRLARTRLSALVEPLETRQLLSVILHTDQPDYAPNSTAIITTTTDGSPDNNFQPGEVVQFHMDRTDGGTITAPPAIQDWNVTDGDGGFTPYEDPSTGMWWFPDTDGAADGNIGTSWYVDSQFAGASLELTATARPGLGRP